MFRSYRDLWMVFFTAPMLVLSSVGFAQQEPYLDYLMEHPTKRLALVIGNETYQHQATIPSSTVDARTVAKTLGELSFKVSEVHDVKNSAEFWHVHFMPFLSKIEENDFILFYFSGHGLSYGGENYIAMLEAQETIPESKALEVLVALTSVRDLITARKPGLAVFILDACRTIGAAIEEDNGNLAAVSKGFAQLPLVLENVAIGFSSDFGKVSKGRSEKDKLSYFTEALLKFLGEEDKEFAYVKRNTRTHLISITAAGQIPWFSDSSSSEIYFKPSQQMIEQERIAWLARLKTNEYIQIWNFTLEYAVSRFAASAKKWLADFKTRQAGSTKISPASLEAAWSTDPGKPISIPRIDGPFAFDKIVHYANVASAYDRHSAALNSREAADILAEHGSVVVTRALSAKALPRATAPSLAMIEPGTTVNITGVAEISRGDPWLQIASPAGDVYLPAGRIVLGKTPVVFSLREIEVSPAATGLASLVDEQVIRDAVTALQREGRSIARVSISTPATQNKTLEVKLAGRLAHAILVLEEAGIARGAVSAVQGVQTLSGENMRLKFFGK